MSPGELVAGGVVLLGLGALVWAGIWIDLLLGGPDEEIG